MRRDLVEQARTGDHDAFTALAAGSLARLYAVAGLIVGDGDLAADAVQEALVAAWRDIRGLRDPDRFDAWLHRLVVRACYRQVRRERRRSVVELQVSSPGEPTGAGPEASIATRDQLDRGFERLAVDHRAVLVLHHYVGLPLDAVAEILEIPPGTARSRLNRATAAMRAALEADDRAPTLHVERTT